MARLLDGKAVVAEVNCDADDLAETCSKYKAGDLGAGEAAIKIFQAGSKRAPAAYTKVSARKGGGSVALLNETLQRQTALSVV